MANPSYRPSPFFDPGPIASADSLAILHLKRDQLVPAVLHSSAEHANGYAEGAVINTRFGSFPHSTLLGNPWGQQVLASKVDTGSRGRPNKKRKREDADAEEEEGDLKQAVTAGTGFIHLLPPTPESWTLSLPHRTQVVYTPDSSYVLQRLRVRPGQTIIEAGAGSGSFTHAAARAVFSGHPPREVLESPLKKQKRRYGRVCSFEYHEPRAEGLRKEIRDHGLEDIVHVTHRDVYQDGFNLGDAEKESPKANAVFLDLPAPWVALKHLTRQAIAPRMAHRISNPTDGGQADASTSEDQETGSGSSTQPFISPLDPESSIQLCTFSPCIEQVQSTVSALRQLGWTEIEMVEVQHRRIDVRRERVGLHEEGLRGVNPSASSVGEAVGRLRDVEGRFREWRDRTHDPRKRGKQNGGAADKHGHEEVKNEEGSSEDTTPADVEMKDDHDEQADATIPKQRHGRPPLTNITRQQRLDNIKREAENRKVFKEGILVHRTEPEIKSHTSYLCFAVLPREWTDEDESRCLAKWGEGPAIKEEDLGGKGKGKKGAVQHGEPGSKKKKRAERYKAHKAENATDGAKDGKDEGLGNVEKNVQQDEKRSDGLGKDVEDGGVRLD